MGARPLGTTCEEVEKLLHMKHQTASARRTELRYNGYTDYLKDSGNKVRRRTDSGRTAFVEIATRLGIEAIRRNLPLMFIGRDIMQHGGDAASQDAYDSIDSTVIAREVLRCMCRYTP